MIEKAQQKKNENKNLTDKLFFARSTVKQLRLRRKTLKEKLAQFSAEGNIKAIAAKLIQAEKEGKLENENVLVDLLDTVS